MNAVRVDTIDATTAIDIDNTAFRTYDIYNRVYYIEIYENIMIQ